MPYGATHTHVHKETNSQSGGRENSKTSIHTGPAVSGSVKKNTDMSHGLGRAPRGKETAPASAKQYKK